MNLTKPNQHKNKWWLFSAFYMTRGVFWILSNIYENSYNTWKQLTLYKKRSFPLRISSVNATKSAVSCRFGYIYWKNLNGKLLFLCSVTPYSSYVISQKALSYVFDRDLNMHLIPKWTHNRQLEYIKRSYNTQHVFLTLYVFFV